MNPYFIQFIGFLGLLGIVISFQKDKRSFTLIAQLFATLLFALHFSLLHAWSGAAMNAIAALRAFVFNQRDSKTYLDRKSVMYGFILLFWIIGLIVWERPIDLLPVVSMTIECFALWSRKTDNLRWLFLLARPPWIIYHALVGSWAGLATETFILVSISRAIFRFGVKRNKGRKQGR